MPLFVLLLILPLAEIALFIAIGGQIGVWATLALVVLGVLGGSLILRGQQERTQLLMQGGLRGVKPGTFLAQGAFRVAAGILLIAPGFLTDLLGLALLVPPLQRLLVRLIGAHVAVATAHVRREGDIVEGDFEVHEPGRPVRHLHRIEDHRGH